MSSRAFSTRLVECINIRKKQISESIVGSMSKEVNRYFLEQNPITLKLLEKE